MGTAIRTTSWTRAVKNSADPQRAKHVLELLAVTSARSALTKASAEQAGIFGALFGGSQALSGLLIKHPDWCSWLTQDSLKFPRRKQGLRQEVERRVKPWLATRQYPSALAQ